MKNRFARFVAAQMALCLLLLWVWPRMELDDSYIFLTYARNLATVGKFFFNPGVPSYGFSSPAYVMFLAGASRLTGIPVGVLLSNLLGLLCCLLSSCGLWMLWGTLEQEPTQGDLPFAALLMSGPWFFTVWFLFGMESGLAVTALLGLLLWLAKLRVGAPRYPWLLLGIVSAVVLATTRLESCIFIACALLLALLGRRSGGMVSIADLAIVGAVSGTAEVTWLLYAHHTFGTYMPWSGHARLLYYLPGRFGISSAAQYFSFGLVARSVVALKAATSILFAGMLKILLLFLPLVAAVLYLRSSREAKAWKWMLQLTVFGLIVQIVCFAYLFPLAQNRHFAPYIAGLWAILVPGLLRTVRGWKPAWRVAALAVVIMSWLGGAAQYRYAGAHVNPLYDIAASGILKYGDKLGAESIGILSFQTPAQIVDLGGLTDRDSWPLLTFNQQKDQQRVLRWELAKGATKSLVISKWCPGDGHPFGRYCVIDASVARRLSQQDIETIPASAAEPRPNQ